MNGIKKPRQSRKFSPRFHYAMGNDFYGKEEYEMAVHSYTICLLLDPKYVSAYNGRGIAYGMLERYEEALNDLTQAIAILPNYEAAYYNIGMTYWMMGRIDRGIENVRRAIELAPEIALYHVNLAHAYFELGDIDFGIEELSKAITIEGTAENYTQRGTALARLNQFEKAGKDFEKAQELSRNDIVSFANLVWVKAIIETDNSTRGVGTNNGELSCE